MRPAATQLHALVGWLATRAPISGGSSFVKASECLMASTASSSAAWGPSCSYQTFQSGTPGSALQAFKRSMGSWVLGSTGAVPKGMGSSSLVSPLRLAGSASVNNSAIMALVSSGGRATFSTATATAGTTMRSAAQSILVGSEALTHNLSDSARKQMAWWLGGTAVWVYSMVVLGGMTRLTRSGLSMTEWKFTGERPPMTQEDWQAEFDKYRASPEFKKLHSKMTLEEFKFIFWMEYGHRMWGRLLGVTFLVPGTYFLSRGYINAALGKRLGLLFFMGGTQGLVGWWMVRSGLQEPEHEWETPRVSPYRLAAHLVSAFTIYSILVWTTLDLAYPRALMSAAGQAAKEAGQRVRSRVLPFSALVAVTAASGAFVAGKDAGRAYNTYPLMNGKFFPDEYWDTSLKPIIRNAFENTAAIQFHHRTLAATTALSTLLLWPWVRSSAAPGAVKRAMDLVVGVTVLQMTLGIWTLLEYVPVHLGTLHQANALNLFTSVLLMLHTLRPAQPGPLSHAAARFGTPLAAALVAGVGYAVTTQQ